ncbi:MAG: hypothetical protein D6705_05260 [Deltaproteobacteria bacterium]|nr:MAG: hypothetical protein D6705_05260 [Deltaproteobacteria bacterium]
MTGGTEVKGIWFLSAQRYLREAHGEDLVTTVAEAMLPEHRPIFVDALPGEWYPESALQDMLSVLYGQLARGDDQVFVRFVEEASIYGTGRFFRVLLALASSRFLLRRVPVLWDRMRRGGGRVEVDQDGAVTVLRYREFPYFDDPNYRLMTVGTIRGLCRVAGDQDPVVEIAEHGRDFLDVRVRHEAERR